MSQESQDSTEFSATSLALYVSVKDAALDKKTPTNRGGRHLMPVSLAYPGNVQLSEARPSVSPDSATSARYSYGGHEGLSAALSALPSRDPALATAAAARLGEEWNLPPQSEAALRTHIASALEPLSTFPTDGLRSEQLIDIELDIRDDNGASVLKDTIKWNVNDVLGRMSGPETFAFTTCADLGLPPKYRGIIAGVIRERLQQEIQKQQQKE